ncbi:hypothetical protein [Rossellomorea marisflavi]|uniref:hypothetical protein n=1 Tax=Rossellomorea marisflavi TaxID=189381 RepID=UPI00064E906F|nr:hypothetical protein [Rossellomorea marisflavi]KMK93716.1 hypothetical protein VL03_12665 [Rossellomorea marisflavi]
MKTAKGAALIGEFNVLLLEMRKKLNEENIADYVKKFGKLYVKLVKFNRKSKDARFKAGFVKAEEATGRMLEFLKGKGDPKVCNEAIEMLREAVKLMPGDRT